MAPFVYLLVCGPGQLTRLLIFDRDVFLNVDSAYLTSSKPYPLFTRTSVLTPGPSAIAATVISAVDRSVLPGPSDLYASV